MPLSLAALPGEVSGRTCPLAWKMLTFPGPGYIHGEIYNLAAMKPYSLKDIYEPFAKVSEHVVLYLPRTSDLRQLAAVVKDGQKVEVIHYCTEGFSRALCAYLGPFNFS